jgi:hypothetical protein
MPPDREPRVSDNRTKFHKLLSKLFHFDSTDFILGRMLGRTRSGCKSDEDFLATSSVTKDAHKVLVSGDFSVPDAQTLLGHSQEHTLTPMEA